jgi:hypothetical protein
VILTSQVVKLGYRWVHGNGKKVHFWEDTWFGTAPLAVQFCKLYCVFNEKASTIAEVWVEGKLRLSFRRTFFDLMMQRWDELMSIVE